MPTWSDRVFESNYLDDPTETVILVICLVILVLIFILMGVVFWKKDTAVIKAASPVFLYIIMGGSIIPIAGVMMYENSNCPQSLVLNTQLDASHRKCILLF